MLVDGGRPQENYMRVDAAKIAAAATKLVKM
jgi:hypothetical protein